MPRTTKLLALAACALAVAIAWFVSHDTPTMPATVAPAATPRTGSVAHREPRVHGATADADAAAAFDADAPPKPTKPPGHLIVHVVAAEDERPIAGARVEVPSEGEERTYATTDATGDARIDVPMAAEHPDAADRHLYATAPNRVREMIRVIVESASEQRVTVKLRPGFSVEGVVHDPAGHPIAGARVSAAQTRKGGFEDEDVADSTGDDQGRFRLDGLPLDERLHITITAARHVKTRISRWPHETTPIDVTLDAAGTIHGVVRSADGTPVRGANVTASPVSVEGEDSSVGGESDRTDDDGAFEIDGLPLGHAWTLVAGHDDFMVSAESREIVLEPAHLSASCDLSLRAVARLDVDLAFAGEHEWWIALVSCDRGGDMSCSVPGHAGYVVREPGLWHVDAGVAGLRRGSAEVEIGPGETRTLTFRFDEGVSLAGIVVDDVGAPVAGAVVRAKSVAKWHQFAVSAPDGTFIVKGLADGSHKLRVTASGYGDGVVEDVVVPGEKVKLVVPRNGEMAMRLRLPDSAARPAMLTIRRWGDPAGDKVEVPWADGEIVRSLPPRSYNMEIEVEGYVKWARDGVEIRAGQRNDLGEIVLDPGLPLSGRVVDHDGQGVPRVDVFIDSDLIHTDASGYFKSEHTAAGPHEIEVKFSPDFVDVTVPVTLTKDTPPLVITLQRGSRLRVTVRGITREMSDTINVWAVPPGRPADAERDGRDELSEIESGRYESRLPAGARRIEVRREDATLATKGVDLREGEDVTVEIVLGK